MTCVVAMIKKGTVYMGADSAASNGWETRIRKDKKVFKNGPMIFGFCGSFRIGQLLQHKLAIPNHAVDKDVYQYMVQDFIEAVRACLKEGGAAQTDKETHTMDFSNFMVGYRGRLFYIQADFQVGEPRDIYHAIGCGENYALGSLHRRHSADPYTSLRLALEAAEHFSNGVRGPFEYISVNKAGK